MQTHPTNCISSMLSEQVGPLCSGLKQLKEEHIPLTAQMEAIYKLTQSIDENEVEANYDTLQELYNLVKSFVSELEPHSEREEGILFEMVAAYIGRTNGPIGVMEYEHDQAKMLLRKFLVEAEESTSTIEPNEVKNIASYAAKAYLILTDHFMKEETVLFPLANQLLTQSEKEILQEKINLV